MKILNKFLEITYPKNKLIKNILLGICYVMICLNLYWGAVITTVLPKWTILTNLIMMGITLAGLVLLIAAEIHNRKQILKNHVEIKTQEDVK